MEQWNEFAIAGEIQITFAVSERKREAILVRSC